MTDDTDTPTHDTLEVESETATILNPSDDSGLNRRKFLAAAAAGGGLALAGCAAEDDGESGGDGGGDGGGGGGGQNQLTPPPKPPVPNDDQYWAFVVESLDYQNRALDRLLGDGGDG